MNKKIFIFNILIVVLFVSAIVVKAENSNYINQYNNQQKSVPNTQIFMTGNGQPIYQSPQGQVYMYNTQNFNNSYKEQESNFKQQIEQPVPQETLEQPKQEKTTPKRSYWDF